MYNKNKEFEEFELEKKHFEVKADSYKNDLAESLIKRGMGGEIQQTLKNPIKVTSLQLFKFKVNNFFKMLFDVI